MSSVSFGVLPIAHAVPPTTHYITNCTDLQAISSGDLGATYVQTADIDCNGVDFQPIGNDSTPFFGYYNGAGFTIANLTINSSQNYVGLFGEVSGGSITGVSIISGDIQSSSFMGALVGYNNGTISRSFSYATVHGTGNFIGGLVGLNYDNGTITDSYSAGDTVANGANYVGGLVGQNRGTITNTYSKGPVYGTTSVGGLVGRHLVGTISNSFSASHVTSQSDTPGGLVGESSFSLYGGVYGTILNSYWSSTVSGLSHCYGDNPTTGGETDCTNTVQPASNWFIKNAPVDTWDFTPGFGYWSFINAELPEAVTLMPADYYRFDEDGGNTAGDSGANTINGNLNGSTYNSSDMPPLGHTNTDSMSFNGDGDYIDLNTDSRFDLVGNFTVSVMAKADPAKQGVFLLNEHPDASPDDEGSNYGVTYGMYGSGKFAFYSENYTSVDDPNTALTTKVTDDKWHMITWTYDGTTLRGYLDGVLDVSKTAAITLGTDPSHMYIGQRAPFSSNTSYQGLMDEVRIYHRALSPVEILAINHHIHYVSSCTDLQAVNNDLSATYQQTKNIDCTGVDFQPIGMDQFGQWFTGTYDGSNHVISNLNITVASDNGVGLFGSIGESGHVKNLGIVNGTITNLNSGAAGGFVGVNYGTVQNSFAKVKVVAHGNYNGGFAGVHLGAMSDVYATGKIISTGEGNGGLVGLDFGAVSDAYATGAVNGLAGDNGGIDGISVGSNLSNVFATSVIGSSGPNNGGIVGLVAAESSLSNIVWSSVLSGQSACGFSSCTDAASGLSYFASNNHDPITALDNSGQWWVSDDQLPKLRWEAPISYFRFDGSNGVANMTQDDGVGNNAALILYPDENKPAYSTSDLPHSATLFNYDSISFDGTSQYLTRGSSTTVPSSNLTLCTWLKTSSSGTDQSLVEQGRNVNDADTEYGFQVKANGHLNFWDYDVNFGFVVPYFEPGQESNSAVNDGQWHHACFVKDHVSGTYYVDGVPDGTVTADHDATYSNNDFTVAQDARDGGSYFSGSLDQLSVFNRSLSTPEIADLANLNADKHVSSTVSDACTLGAHWTMDEGTGTTIADSSGEGHEGAFNSSDLLPEFSGDVPGTKFTNAYSLAFTPGNNERVKISKTVTNHYTLSMWIKTSGQMNQYAALLTKDVNSGLYYKNNNLLNYYDNSDGEIDINSDTFMSTDTWHHVAFVNNGGQGTFFVDGHADGTFTGAVGTDLSTIGGDSGSEDFPGQIDDVRVYDTALSDADVATLADGEDPCPSPVSRWKFDEGAGTTPADSLGGRDGSFVNTPAYATDVAPTVFNNPYDLQFDGNGSYVGASDSGLPMDNAPRTMSAWVKVTGENGLPEIPFAYGQCNNSSTVYGVYIYGGILYFWGCGGADYSTGQALAIGTWYHIAITTDGTTVRTYVDGTQVASADEALNTQPAAVAIGSNGGTTSGTFYFPGYVDDVRVYDYALNPSQISELALRSDSGGSSSSSSDSSSSSSAGTTITWTGAGSNEWFVSSNWDLNLIPDSTMDVVVPATSRDPILSENDANVKTLTIQAGATVHLNGQGLNFTNPSSFTNFGTLALNGNEVLTNFTNDTSNNGTILYEHAGSYANLPTGDSYENLIVGEKPNPIAAHWNFDSDNGSTYTDSSPYSDTGYGEGEGGLPTIDTNVPSVMFTDTHSLNFSGSNQWVQAGDNGALGMTDSMTVGTWIYWNGPMDGSDTNNQTIIDKTDGVNTNYSMYVKSDGTLGVSDTNGNFESSPGQIPINQWTHVAFTDDNGSATLYVNNVSVNQENFKLGDRNQATLYIGKDVNGGRFFHGNIDDLQIYPCALSDNQIGGIAGMGETTCPMSSVHANYTVNTSFIVAQNLTIGSRASLDANGHQFVTGGGGLYNNGTLILNGGETFASTISTDTGTVLYRDFSGNFNAGMTYHNLTLNDGLVGYWRFNSNGEITQPDASGYDNDAVLMNTPVIAPESPETAFSNGASLELSAASSQYAAVDVASHIPIGDSAYTISAWIKPNVMGSYGVIGWGNSGVDDQVNGFTLTNDGIKNYWWNNDVAASTGDLSGTWHHVLAEYDGTTRSLYVDGTRVGSDIPATSPMFGTPAAHAVPTADNFSIGRSGPALNDYFDGLIDEVRVYNYALTPDAIAALAAGSEPATGTKTFAMSDTLAVHGTLRLNSGTLDSGGENINLGGEWLNAGGVFTPRGATVTLYGAEGANGSILSGGQQFYYLSIQNGQYVTRDMLRVHDLATSVGAILNSDALQQNIFAESVHESAANEITPASPFGITLDPIQSASLSLYDVSDLTLESPLEAGLIGYWKLDEGQGGVAHDSTQQHDGTIVAANGNAPLWKSDDIADTWFSNFFSMRFNGDGQHVMTPLSMSSMTQFTISGWVNPASGNIHGAFFGQNDAIEFGIMSASSIECWTANGGSISWSYAGQEDVFDNHWHHVACTANGDTLTLYVDGVAVATGGNSTDNYGISGDTFTIAGHVFDTLNDDFLSGTIDDVRVYNVALTADEVQNVYHGHYAHGGVDPGAVHTELSHELSANSLLLQSGYLSANGNDVTVDGNVQLRPGDGQFEGTDGVDIHGSLNLYGSTFTGGRTMTGTDMNLYGGTFYAPLITLNVLGNWTKYPDATFDGNKYYSVVEFAGSGSVQTLSGSTTFKNVLATKPSQLLFHDGDTFTISNDITVQGTADHVIELDGTGSGTWNIDPRGTRTFQYVNVAASTNLNESHIDCTDASNHCGDSGGNTAWDFPALTCGNGNFEGGEQCDDGNAVNGDGCDSSCNVEEGYDCSQILGQQSTCYPACNYGPYPAIRIHHTCYSYIPTYLLGGQGVDWNYAQFICQNYIGGDIATVSGSTLNTALTTIIGADGWIGLNDQQANGTFVWAAGDTIDYLNWAAGQPDGVDHCVIFNPDGSWGTHDCNEQHAFYCATPDPVCGNGIGEQGENCDDGNLTNGDGCSDACNVENGYACRYQQAHPNNVCHAITCGDSFLDNGEQCDDGNTTNGDGCDSSCAVESNWLCTEEDHSVCHAVVCGDGVVEGSEACDDGNTSNGDGCNNSCTVEDQWTCSGAPSTCIYHGACTETHDADQSLRADNSTCYAYYSTAKTWSNAHDDCVSRGGTLAAVHNATQDAAITLIGQVAWIGGTDAVTESNFIWDGDTTPFCVGNNYCAPQSGAYTNWNWGEPNDSSGIEDCTQTYPDGVWNDLYCEDEMSYICQFPDVISSSSSSSSSVSSESEAGTTGGGGGGGGGTTGGGGGGGGGGRTLGFVQNVQSNAAQVLKSEVVHQAGGSSAGHHEHVKVTLQGVTQVFNDVWTDDWFGDYVKQVAEKKIFSGYKSDKGEPLNKYGPADSITMGQLAKIALKIVHRSVSGPINGDQWATPYIDAARSMKLYTFLGVPDPNKAATRGQVIETIFEALHIPMTESTTTFTDVPNSYPYLRSIATAEKMGIIGGDAAKRTFRPDEPINRAEVAKILALLGNRIGVTTEDVFVPASSASSHSALAVASAATSSIASMLSQSSSEIPVQRTIISKRLTIYMDSRITSAVSGKLFGGNTITVLRTVHNDWAYIRTSWGKEGYVLNKYLQ